MQATRASTITEVKLSHYVDELNEALDQERDHLRKTESQHRELTKAFVAERDQHRVEVDALQQELHAAQSCSKRASIAETGLRDRVQRLTEELRLERESRKTEEEALQQQLKEARVVLRLKSAVELQLKQQVQELDEALEIEREQRRLDIETLQGQFEEDIAIEREQHSLSIIQKQQQVEELQLAVARTMNGCQRAIEREQGLVSTAADTELSEEATELLQPASIAEVRRLSQNASIHFIDETEFAPSDLDSGGRINDGSVIEHGVVSRSSKLDTEPAAAEVSTGVSSAADRSLSTTSLSRAASVDTSEGLKAKVRRTSALSTTTESSSRKHCPAETDRGSLSPSASIASFGEQGKEGDAFREQLSKVFTTEATSDAKCASKRCTSYNDRESKEETERTTAAAADQTHMCVSEHLEISYGDSRQQSAEATDSMMCAELQEQSMASPEGDELMKAYELLRMEYSKFKEEAAEEVRKLSERVEELERGSSGRSLRVLELEDECRSLEERIRLAADSFSYAVDEWTKLVEEVQSSALRHGQRLSQMASDRKSATPDMMKRACVNFHEDVASYWNDCAEQILNKQTTLLDELQSSCSSKKSKEVQRLETELKLTKEKMAVLKRESEREICELQTEVDRLCQDLKATRSQTSLAVPWFFCAR
eukprot:TRINITY_DN15172_c0_g2_i1.p1 TRINITY_DN15172_c0_g2~~TRINITY_DN15172_c0_g2_i1.p1  ORF type:complete len:657 (-),score=131.41 TRINITY_DN15172_c0_g2_i1:569-2539(-)